MSKEMSQRSNEGHDKDEHKQSFALSRRQIFAKGGLLAGILSALSFTPFSWAEAATRVSQDPIQVSDLTGAKATKYVQATLTSADYLQFKRQFAQQYAGTFTIQESRARVTQIKTASDQVVIVRLPIQGGAGYSFYAATFQPNTTTPLSRRTGLFLPAGGGTIHAIMTRDGQVIFDGTISSDGSSISGTLTTSNGKRIVLRGASAKSAIDQARSATGQVSPASAVGSSDW